MNADEEISYFFNDKEFKYKAISMEVAKKGKKRHISGNAKRCRAKNKEQKRFLIILSFEK